MWLIYIYIYIDIDDLLSFQQYEGVERSIGFDLVMKVKGKQ